MKKFSFYKSLKHDYALLGCIIFMFVTLGFLLYSLYKEEMLIVMIMGVLSFISFLLAFYRTSVINFIFTNGTIVNGLIADVWFHKDRGRVTYVYEYDGSVYSRGNAIMRTKETKNFYKGESIKVIVLGSNPKRAFIAHLYGNTSD